MRNVIIAVVVAAGVLGATCATEPQPVDPSPSPTAGWPPIADGAEGGWRNLDRWTALALAQEGGRLGRCATGLYPSHSCSGPLSGRSYWTLADMHLAVRIKEQLAVLEPDRADHWKGGADHWRGWISDVKARRRWPPHTCYGYDAEGHTGHYDCVGPDWQPSGGLQTPFDRP